MSRDIRLRVWWCARPSGCAGQPAARSEVRRRAAPPPRCRAPSGASLPAKYVSHVDRLNPARTESRSVHRQRTGEPPIGSTCSNIRQAIGFIGQTIGRDREVPSCRGRSPMAIRFPERVGRSTASAAQASCSRSSGIDLRRQLETVRGRAPCAAARRRNPRGLRVPGAARRQQYTTCGCPGSSRPAGRQLAIYNFMFPRDPTDDRPLPTDRTRAELLPICSKRRARRAPRCSTNSTASVPHVSPLMSFVVVAKAPIEPSSTALRRRSCAAGATSASSRRPRQPVQSRRYLARKPTDGRAACRPQRLPCATGRPSGTSGAAELFDEPTEPGAGPAPRRHDRSIVEPARPHARGVAARRPGTSSSPTRRNAARAGARVTVRRTESRGRSPRWRCGTRS